MISRQYRKHKKKHAEHYSKIKSEWSDFERQYWKKHPMDKFCHVCGETNKVELHHIIPRHVDPTKIFDEDNLIPLCRECHFRFGHLRNFEKYYNPEIREFATRTLQMIKKLRSDENGR